MSLGPLLRVGARVRRTPRNRVDGEWPSRWRAAMSARGTLVRTKLTRAGMTMVRVCWDGSRGVSDLHPEYLDYVLAHDGIYRLGERVRLRPTKDVGKVSAIVDWAGAPATITGVAGGDGHVTLRWPSGEAQRVSVFDIEPE